MELYQIHSFLRVADEGSITRAAEALSLTQPAVTQHVRALERDLGVPLFDRTGRGVVLTPAGEALARYARRSVALLEECRQAIADLEAGVAGRLELGAGVTTSIFHLPACLRAFREAYPGVEVVVRSGRSREIAALLLAREIELGLVTSPVPHPDLCETPLYEEEIILVMPPEHPLAGGTLAPAGLEAVPLILFPRGTGFREYLDRTLAEAEIPARVIMEIDSAEAIKSFVQVGLGSSFLPAPAVGAEVADGTLARAAVRGLPALRRRTSILHRRDRHLGGGARAFLRLLRARYAAAEDESPASGAGPARGAGAARPPRRT